MCTAGQGGEPLRRSRYYAEAAAQTASGRRGTMNRADAPTLVCASRTDDHVIATPVERARPSSRNRATNSTLSTPAPRANATSFTFHAPELFRRLGYEEIFRRDGAFLCQITMACAHAKVTPRHRPPEPPAYERGSSARRREAGPLRAELVAAHGPERVEGADRAARGGGRHRALRSAEPRLATGCGLPQAAYSPSIDAASITRR